MSINYYDGTFSSFSYQYAPYVFFRGRYEIIPDNCDNIGITLWDGNFDNYTDLINSLLPKTKTLMLFAPEPVDDYQFIKFINFTKDNPQIKIFGNAVLNFTTPDNYTTIPNWFIACENYYVTKNWAKKLLSQLDFTRTKNKKFDCLLGREKPHRSCIENHYLKSSYRNDIIFTYFKNDISAGAWNFDLQGSSDTVTEISMDGELGQISAILPIDIYNDSYYSVVAETTVSNDYSHLTEKTAKPIIAKRLFIMFAGQYFLRNLKKLGFKTFDNVIDESYDNIADRDARFAAAWDQVEQLCQLDPQVVLNQIEPILEHNQRHFLQTDWHELLHKIIRSMPQPS